MRELVFLFAKCVQNNTDEQIEDEQGSKYEECDEEKDIDGLVIA